jgi:hypothetical protein
MSVMKSALISEAKPEEARQPLIKSKKRKKKK